MSAVIQKSVSVVFLAIAMSTSAESRADEEHFYESLPEVTIGKVFFSPQERARLDQRRSSIPVVRIGGGAAPASTLKKVNDDAAGFIISSKGASKVYSGGDFVTVQHHADVKFPGSVKIVRGQDPDEASDEAD